MALSLLESIRKLIRQDTVKVGGPVGNMHGAVRTDLGSMLASSTQTWLSFQVPGTSLPTLEEFFDIYATSPNALALQVASEGELVYTGATNRLSLLRTVVSAERALSFTLDVTLPASGSAAAFYLDGVLLRTLRGSGAVAINVPAGPHVLYIVVQAPQIKVVAPRGITFVGETDVPAAPRWISLTTGYLDERAGSASNVLRWASDAQVGQYRVLRRMPTLVGDLSVIGDGEVLEVSQIGSNDSFVIVLQGNQRDRLTPNGQLLSAGITVAIVVSVDYSSETGNTIVTCRLPFGATQTPTGVQGTLLSIGTFAEIARVSRVATTATVEYIDSAVTKDVAYEYALQASGLADETVLSELSLTRYVVAGDRAAPSAIVIASGYPKVLNKTATVRFTTPAELDYAGVTAVYRRQVRNNTSAYTATAISIATVTVNSATLPTTSGGLVGYSVQFNVPGYTAYTFEVLSNTASTIQLTDPVPEPLSYSAVGATMSIFKDTPVRTDAGLANRQDELSFEAVDYGEYYFSSFDRAGNQQVYESAAKWTYTEAADTFTSPPVLAIRQLSSGASGEQSYFAAPYNNATQYAIIEVWAYDPQRPVADRFTGVKINYQRIGQDGSAINFPTVPNQAEAFPNTVTSSGEAVLDTPGGTRSRFIAINREYPQIRLWTENSLSQTSDITTFTADHDTTPEAVVETTINPQASTFSFVVVVDDDTQGFTWQVDGGTVYKVDTRSAKRITISSEPAIANDLRLELGQKRTLVVTPYANYTPGPPVTLTTDGPVVARELVRTPRSLVSFDPKDENGDKSATFVTATFAITPSATTLVSGRTGTVTQLASGYRLTDSASPAWTADQYKSTSTAFYYLVLRPTVLPALAVPIQGNGTATLDFTQSILPSYVGSATSYEIVDAAVLWRRVVNGTPVGGFVPAAGTRTFERTSSFELEFYGTKNGCYPENVRRVLVDADSLPSLSGFAYSTQTIGGTPYLVVGFGTADDDATTWEVYEKKGGWPTVSGDAPSASVPPAQNSLDRTYLRFSGSVDETSYRRASNGLSAGTWYAIAVPKNSFGEAGVASTATYVVGAAPTPALDDLVLTPTVGTSTVSVSYPSNAVTPGNTTVDITAVRADNGARVTASRTAAQTPYSLDVGETIVASGGANRTWTVTTALSGYNTITRTTTFQVAQATSATVTATASAIIYSPGNCYNEQCGSPLSSSQIRLISWQVRVNGVLVTSPTSPYYVNIEVTNAGTIDGNTTWVPLVFGLQASAVAYEDSDFCLYSDPAGFLERWTYRIQVTDAQGTLLNVSAVTNTLSAYVALCGRNGPGNAF